MPSTTPSRALAAVALRVRCTWKTVTKDVTQAHRYAFCSPWNQGVSSAFLTGCCCTYLVASATGSARAALTRFWASMTAPVLMGTRKTCVIVSAVTLLLSRSSPARSPTMASTPAV
jgi:hypothetical protein